MGTPEDVQDYLNAALEDGDERLPMIREATTTAVRQQLGYLLDETRDRGDSVVIVEGSKPVAAMIDVSLFRRIRALEEEYARLRADFARSFSTLPEDEGLALIDEAVTAVRRSDA